MMEEAQHYYSKGSHVSPSYPSYTHKWYTYTTTTPPPLEADYSSPFLDEGEGNIDPLEWSWTWDKTLKALVLSPIVILTILGNFLVIYAFLTRKRDLRSPTHYFILNLSIADFLVGLLAMPFLATLQVTDRWYFGPVFCYSWVIIHFWLCSASILSTLGVCVERYIGVKYPLQHMQIMGPLRVKALMAGIWFLAGFLSLLSILPFPQPEVIDPPAFSCNFNNQLGHVLIATIAILYVPAVLMVFLYFQIYLIASKHFNVKKARGVIAPNTQKVNARPRSKTKTWSKLNFFKPPQSSSEEEERSTSDFPMHSGESGISSIGQISSEDSSSSPHNPPPTATSPNLLPSSSSSSKQISLAIRLSALISILLLSYIPFFTVFLLRALFPSSPAINSPLLFSILGWIRYSNSALNPFIYSWAVPRYRSAFLSILKNKK